MRIETVCNSPVIDPRIRVILLHAKAGPRPAQRFLANRSGWAPLGARADARAQLHLCKRSVAGNGTLFAEATTVRQLVDLHCLFKAGFSGQVFDREVAVQDPAQLM